MDAPEPPRGYARAEARNEAVRAMLEPYAPGERPWVVVVSAILAAGLGAVNLVAYLAGASLKVGGTRPGVTGVVPFALVMFALAAGLWQMRYWAVMGFEVLLLILLLVFSILLIEVSNLSGLAVASIGLAVGGLLFYKLIRVMSRMQAADRQPQ